MCWAVDTWSEGTTWLKQLQCNALWAKTDPSQPSVRDVESETGEDEDSCEKSQKGLV